MDPNADLPDKTFAEQQKLAVDAAIWGYPLAMMSRYLDAANTGAVPFNQFFMSTEVATARSLAIGPNIDTVNGRAWIDLDGGPQVIAVPATNDRYFSIQFQDMYTNSFAYLGRRTTGTDAGLFIVTPPGYTGQVPAGMTEIPATTAKILAFVRCLVRGNADLPVALAINAAITIGPLADYPNGRRASVVGDGVLDAFQPPSRVITKKLPHEEIAQSGAAFFDQLNALIAQFPPRDVDKPHLARFAPLGIGAGAEIAHRPENEAMLASAVQQGVAALHNALKTWPVNGWLRRENVKPFIDDPVQRAGNTIYGPNTQVAEESVFFNLRLGPDGQPLTDANSYRLRFAAGEAPPVDAFWSITLYDKKYVLFDNPLNRYGIQYPSDELRYGADGSIEIRVQVNEPDDETVNWLPCPPDGFQLNLRTYQPRQAILDHSYQPPPLEIV